MVVVRVRSQLSVSRNQHRVSDRSRSIAGKPRHEVRSQISGANITQTSSPRAPRASRSLISGAGVLLAARLGGAVLSWTGTVLIIRQLSVVQYGSFASIFNLLGLLGLVADFETTRVVMAEIGRSASDALASIASRFIVFRLALGLVTYGLALLIATIGPYSSLEIQAVAIGGTSYLIASALWSLISVCQAKQWLRVVAAALFLGQVAQFAMVIALYTTHRGSLLRYIVPFVASDAVSLLVVLLVVRRTLRIRLRVDLSSWRRWIIDAAPLAVGTALATLYFRVDSLMLRWVLPGNSGRVAVGIYQIGYKFADLLAFVAPAMIAAMLPVLAKAWPRNLVVFHRTVRQSVVLVMIIASYAVVMFGVFAAPVLGWIRSDYVAAAVPARWLVAAQALNFGTQIVYVCLITVNRRRMYPIIALCGLAINVGLNLMFIPRYGVNGSAAATILTEILVLSLLIVQVADLPLRPLPIRAGAITIASAGAAGAVGFFARTFLAWPLAALLGTVLYVGLLHWLAVDGPGGLPTLRARSHFADE